MWNSEKWSIHCHADLATGLHSAGPKFRFGFWSAKFVPSSAGYYLANIHAIKLKFGGYLALPVNNKISKNKWLLLCSFFHNRARGTLLFFRGKQLSMDERALYEYECYLNENLTICS